MTAIIVSLVYLHQLYSQSPTALLVRHTLNVTGNPSESTGLLAQVDPTPALTGIRAAEVLLETSSESPEFQVQVDYIFGPEERLETLKDLDLTNVQSSEFPGSDIDETITTDRTWDNLDWVTGIDSEIEVLRRIGSGASVEVYEVCYLYLFLRIDDK
jgi:hypothetical protein